MKKYLWIILTAVVTGAIALVLKNGFSKKEWIVGKDIKSQDLTDFYYTLSSSTNPPVFQRYRFYPGDGKHYFYHEKREGDHWPLDESDITVSGEIELSEEQWNRVFELLSEGRVREREDSLESGGSGPWLYLYWLNDKGKINQFEFESAEKKVAFEELCRQLKG